MKLVVDTNIFISALIKDGMARHLLLHLDCELFTIQFSEKEIEKYKHYILKKGQIDNTSFELILNKLKEKVIIIDDRIIMQHFEEAKSIMWPIDPKDTPFIAAALATASDIWSDDPHFQQQNKLKAWKTKDLVKKF